MGASMSRFDQLCGPHPSTLTDHAVVAIVKIRDEWHRLPVFLAYYRWLGVDHFLFIDNGSVDGSIEHLAAQRDATVVGTTESLRNHDEWVRYWFEQLPENTWALVVDMDEHFVCLPWQRGGLKTTVNVLEQSDAQIAVGCMVDFYPAELPHQRSEANELPWQRCPYFDRGPYLKWDLQTVELDGHAKLVSGGVRERVLRPISGVRSTLRILPKFMRGRGWYAAMPQLRKMPLIKRNERVTFQNCHHSRASKYSDTLFPILHFKLDHDFDTKAQLAIERRNYDRASAHIERLSIVLDKPTKLARKSTTRELRSLSSLIDAEACAIGPSFQSVLANADNEISIAEIGAEIVELKNHAG